MYKKQNGVNKKVDMDFLQKRFESAIKEHNVFIGVFIQIEDYKQPELIINHNQNFIDKLTYYQNNYDSKLVHKHSNTIKIIDVIVGNKIEDFDRCFMRNFNLNK